MVFYFDGPVINHINRILLLKKRAVRIIPDAQQLDHCNSLFLKLQQCLNKIKILYLSCNASHQGTLVLSSTKTGYPQLQYEGNNKQNWHTIKYINELSYEFLGLKKMATNYLLK